MSVPMLLRPSLQHFARMADADTLEPLDGGSGWRHPKANAHVHLPPNFSAFDSVEHALDLARTQGVGVLGCSNYYNFEVYDRFADLARDRGIFPLFGLEIISLDESMARDGYRVNDPENPGRFYICGKGFVEFEPQSAGGRVILERIRTNDRERMRRMIDLLNEVFGRHEIKTALTEDGIIEQVAGRSGAPRHTVYLQERHVCRAFQEKFFELMDEPDRHTKLATIYGEPPRADLQDPVSVQNELRSRLVKKGRPGYVEERFVTPQEACQLVLALGAIPCYPVLADGASPICPFEATPETLVENLKQRGFACAELIPLRNEPAVLERYVTALRGAGIVVTGGTEHNTQTLSPIPPLCLGGKPLPERVAEIFWEGACVVAAHQFLKINGREGFVDDEGRPTGQGGEGRIGHYAGLGGAVLKRYFEAFHK